MPPSTISRLTLLSLASQLLFTPCRALSCQSIDRFINYNSTKTYPMPALKINGSRDDDNGYKIVEDPDNSWYLTDRMTNIGTLDVSQSIPTMWINTGNSNLTNMGMCQEVTSIESQGQYQFTREVLERSVNDNGDCKTMLGEECVEALQQHYARAALSSIAAGTCTGNVDWNLTIPYQCAALIGGREKWLGGMGRFGVGTNSTFDEDDFKKCDNYKPGAFNSSIYGSGGMGSTYNATVRFPQPWFFTFWPNRTGDPNIATTSSDDVYVKILCARPDDISEGSLVPPSALELLQRGDAKFAPNASNGNGGQTSSSTAGAAVKTLAPYLGALGMAAALLV